MKNETKKKIAAVSALFTLAAFICTIILVLIEHPAQWDFASASILAFGVAIFTTCTTID